MSIMQELLKLQQFKHGTIVKCVTAPQHIKLKSYSKKKECFANAANIVMSNDNFVYCVGMATQSQLPIPLEHAWVYDKTTNEYYDTTWEQYGDVEGEYLVQHKLTHSELMEYLLHSSLIPPTAFEIAMYLKKRK